MSTPPLPCGACGQSVSGNFCAHCGAAAPGRQCGACQAELTPGASFCHRCGAAASPAVRVVGRDRTAWIVAGVALLIAAAGFTYVLGRGAVPAPTVAAMPNTGNIGLETGPGGRAPDISQMSPVERFTRLHDRIMQAVDRGDSTTVLNFTPMALGAYAQLDTIDVDLRYHAAVLHTQVGDYPPALALADTILSVSPGNLFGYMVRATVAELQGDSAALATARRDFLAGWDRQIVQRRPEYVDHRTLLDAFRAEALQR